MIRERLVHIHYEDEVMQGEDNGLIKATKDLAAYVQ